MSPYNGHRWLTCLLLILIVVVGAGCEPQPVSILSVSPAAGSEIDLLADGVFEVRVEFSAPIHPDEITLRYSGRSGSAQSYQGARAALIRIDTGLPRGFGPYSFSAVFRDSQGREIPLEWDGTVRVGAVPDPAESPYDTTTLRAGASFEVPVAEGVYWVPANSLGAPEFTTQELLELGRDPEVLRARINTLYDVIHYIQAVSFRGASDNITQQHGAVFWEFHKPGPDAVRTNEGNCATISNLLAYMLAGDYDEVGFMAYSEERGSGHVFNYIRHEGSYYTVDLTHHRLDSLSTAVETGDLEDLHRVDRILGNVLRSGRLEDFVAYSLAQADDPPKLYVAYAAGSVLDIGLRYPRDGRVEVCYPTGPDIHVLWDDPHDRLSLRFIAGPLATPNWDHVPTATLGPRPGTVPAVLEIRFSQNPWRIFDGGGQQNWGQRSELAETSGVDVRLVTWSRSLMHHDGYYHEDAMVHPAFDALGDRNDLRGGTSLFWRHGGSGQWGVVFEDHTWRGIDANGHWVSATARVYFEHGPPPISADSYNRSSTEPSPYDTENLRAGADFRIGVAPGVYWIPTVSLGRPEHTRQEILDLGRNPETLRAKINTLYDAIHYVQAARFADALDNRRIKEGVIDWEHHKPGQHAIRTNEGCCATISNLLAYLLAGDYEEIGFLQYSDADGGGHVQNYIRHEGRYYVLDMTYHRSDFLQGRLETGEAHHYFPRNNFIGGYVHEVQRLDDYVAYCMAEFNEPPALWTCYTAPGVLPIGTVFGQDPVTLYYPVGSKVQVLWDDPDDALFLKFVPGPTQRPDWSK